MKIIDDFLEQKQFQKLKEDVLSTHFPWYLQLGITKEKEYDDSCLFTHVFYENEKVISPGFVIVQPILDKLKIKQLLRIKANLYPNNGIFTKHKKHKDFDFSHQGVLLSINTNNGFTILEDDLQVNSIENRALFFNPGLNHQSTSCTNAKMRVNILINYL